MIVVYWKLETYYIILLIDLMICDGAHVNIMRTLS
jgi:hypothetical protein